MVCNIMEQFGVYIHIPFCRQKCFYCDFPSFAGRERLIDGYLEALEQEFCLRQQEGLAGFGQLGASTVYIGGGTPTALNHVQMKRLLDIVRRHIAVAAVEEFTVEMNPGTVDEAKLQLLKNAGVNRLSMGVQSFDDACLKKIGRIHTAHEAEQAVYMARRAGFDNISLDLIYGLPGQDMDILRQSVERALALPVRHISIYGLQLEEGTAFARMADMGKLVLPEDEVVEAMYDYMAERLPRAGYQRYEISNFAQIGYESRHNLSYWQDVPYMGFGSGAHGYWQNCRYENPADIEEYIAVLGQGRLPAILEEQVDEKAHIEEYCFLGLRTVQGISEGKFQSKFGKSLAEVYG